jgi:Uma2 family endonuclease
VILGDRSASEPDLALLRWRDVYYAEMQPGPEDLLLIIEVSDTSLAYDCEITLPLYARFQIPEVWILDIQGGYLEIHWEPDAGRYTLQFRPKDLSRVTIAALPDLELDPRDLL